RIQPVAGFSLVSAAGAAEEKTGEQVYAATCSACHTGGVAGAPKLGDAAAWAPLIAKGYDALLKNAINGVNAMPPRGGNPALSDLEVGRAVVHIANQSGASFPEPEGSGDAAAAEAAPAEAPAAEQAAAPAAETQQPAAEAAAPAAGGDIDLAAGEQLYKSVCFACHSAGVAGAPKVGDKAAWEPLIAA